jgi:RNA recognition motif-containing protein
MKLFVQGFPYDVTERELQTCLEQWGQVEEIRIIRERETGQSKGYAFATMTHARDGWLAIEQLDRSEWGNRRLHVAEARPREAWPPGRSGTQTISSRKRFEENGRDALHDRL